MCFVGLADFHRSIDFVLRSAWSGTWHPFSERYQVGSSTLLLIQFIHLTFSHPHGILIGLLATLSAVIKSPLGITGESGFTGHRAWALGLGAFLNAPYKRFLGLGDVDGD